jgi:hypothetical protein
MVGVEHEHGEIRVGGARVGEAWSRFSAVSAWTTSPSAVTSMGRAVMRAHLPRAQTWRRARPTITGK